MIHKYEQLIIDNIVSRLSIDNESLRWFPFYSMLPNSNCDLFPLFDAVQKSGVFFEKNDAQKQFSTIYGALLEAQKQSFVTDIAKKNYDNKENWLNCNATNIPYYSPNLDQIYKANANGTSFDFTFDSTNFTFDANDVLPTFPSFLINPSFLNFIDKFKPTRFIFKIHFDKIALLPIQFGNWYSSAAFTTAYKNQDNWIKESGLITWNSLFGKNGILNFITNGILLASGMDLEIQFFGNYDENHLESLKDNSNSIVSPFNLITETLNLKYKLYKNHSLTIKTKTNEKSILMLALQIEKINQLMG